MNIVVLDGHTENPGDLDWKPLEQLGDLTVYERTSFQESPLIAERIGEAEIAVVNKTPISRATIDKCRNLKAIAVMATGYNTIDITYARTKQIPVMNVPVYGTENVSQFAVSLLLEVCSQVGFHNASVHAGEWTTCKDWCYWKKPLIEVSGKTAGIIGLGRIGMATARILKAMNMKVVAYDPQNQRAEPGTAECVTWDKLLQESDFIFLHCPYTTATERMINKECISKMKDGVILINNSRGQLVDETALADALNCGKVGAAALDVVTEEPIQKDNPLLTAKNCILTPHISWTAKEARMRIMDVTASNIFGFIKGNPLNVVNS